MDLASRIAFVQAQTLCAYAEIEAMKASNTERLASGYVLAYNEAAFLAIPDKFQLGWNTVLEYFREG